MPVSKPAPIRHRDSVTNDLLESFDVIEAHPFDDIRKHDYRFQAEGWYMSAGDYASKFGPCWDSKTSSQQWARNALIEAGIGTDQFSISTMIPDPVTKTQTVWVFKIDKSLPNSRQIGQK